MARTFNAILREHGIEPAGVRLLRHVEQRARRRVFDAAVNRDRRFDAYQESQSTPVVIRAFEAARYLASFVVDPDSGDVVFAGVWQVLDRSKEPAENPFVSDGAMTGIRFRTRRVEAFEKYRGKLVIEWGPAARAWVQRAERQDKPVIRERSDT